MQPPMIMRSCPSGGVSARSSRPLLVEFSLRPGIFGGATKQKSKLKNYFRKLFCLLGMRFGLTGLLLFQETPVVDARWDRLVPPRIRLWAQDREVRTWATTELMRHSTLPHSDAWHAAYGAVATVHYAYDLHGAGTRLGPALGGIGLESRRFRPGCFRGPSSSSDVARTRPVRRLSS